jgi:hypothetical protein
MVIHRHAHCSEIDNSKFRWEDWLCELGWWLLLPLYCPVAIVRHSCFSSARTPRFLCHDLRVRPPSYIYLCLMWVCAVLFPLNNLELNNEHRGIMGTAVRYYATVAYCALALLRTSLTGGMEQMHRIEQYLQVSVPSCAVSPQTLISHLSMHAHCTICSAKRIKRSRRRLLQEVQERSKVGQRKGWQVKKLRQNIRFLLLTTKNSPSTQ